MRPTTSALPHTRDQTIPALQASGRCFFQTPLHQLNTSASNPRLPPPFSPSTPQHLANSPAQNSQLDNITKMSDKGYSYKSSGTNRDVSIVRRLGMAQLTDCHRAITTAPVTMAAAQQTQTRTTTPTRMFCPSKTDVR
jgi:hypothetical protein